MSKQTALQWFLDKLPHSIETQFSEQIQQALQMEKEHNEYFFNCGRQYQLTGEGRFKQVHNETYEGQDE